MQLELVFFYKCKIYINMYTFIRVMCIQYASYSKLRNIFFRRLKIDRHNHRLNISARYFNKNIYRMYNKASIF